MKLKVFEMEGTPLWSLGGNALVAAPDELDAKAFLTSGSDSCWSDITKIKQVDEREFCEEDLLDNFSRGDCYLLEMWK